jgi:hypothetical protein
MVVEQPGSDPRWDYRRAAVERIHGAVREMLVTSAGAVSGSLVTRAAGFAIRHHGSGDEASQRTRNANQTAKQEGKTGKQDRRTK